jgi:parvulin-like peptidyl-prolyl isomerase
MNPPSRTSGRRSEPNARVRPVRWPWLLVLAVVAATGLAAAQQPLPPVSDADLLFREALRRGYALDDLIVRRQLVRRMRDALEQEQPVSMPDDATLAAYLEQHATRFQQPARYSFDQVYLSRGAHGAALQADAAVVALRLRQSADSFAQLGDAFPQGRHLEQRDAVQVEADFGHALAETLPRLLVGRWQGPLQSPLGLHFVRITALEPARTLTLAEARARVLLEYRQAQQQQNLRNAIARLRQDPALTAPLPPPATLPDEDLP